MKRVKWYLGLLLVSILLLVGGCGVTEEPPVIPPVSPVAPTSDISIPIEEFPNQPHIDAVMSALVGQELTVTLGSNPTTGFQWSELADIGDETVIQQVSHKFMYPEALADPPIPGTPGIEVWTFKALKEGTTTILLEYSRPWNEKDIGLWAVTIAVTIK